MRFYDYQSDVNWKDYGGTWIAQRRYGPKATDVEYTFVQFINWEDATGERAHVQYDHNVIGTIAKDNRYRYATEVWTVDLAWYTPQEIASALECVDCHPETLPPHRRNREIAEALYRYGRGDLGDTYYSNNAYTLLRQSKARL